MTQPKILIIGDAVAPTGFGRVIRNIFEPLQDQFELHQLATRYDGGPHDYPWKLYAAGKGASVYGYDQIAPLIEEIQPALIFLLYDIPFQVRYMEQIRAALSKSKTSTTNPTAGPQVVMYSPVESGPIAPEMIARLAGVARYVLYTNYGRSEIEQSLATIRRSEPGFRFPSLEVIPHGVDTKKFYPIHDSVRRPGANDERRLIARKALGFSDAEHLESFIVLNANRNMPRKRIDITMQGFALFALDKPKKVKLYLHMAPALFSSLASAPLAITLKECSKVMSVCRLAQH